MKFKKIEINLYMTDFEGGYYYEEVRAYQIDSPEVPEFANIAVHRASHSGWKVSDIETGSAIPGATGTTRVEAAGRAITSILAIGKEKYLKGVARTKKWQAEHTKGRKEHDE